MKKFKRPKSTRKVAKIGDKITFTVWARQGYETGTRVVKKICDATGNYLVGFRGYTDFQVKRLEVSEVTRKTK